MAGAVNALFGVVGVFCLLGVCVGVSAQSGAICPSVEMCSEDFNNKAMHIGHDREKLCLLIKERLACYHRERVSCSSEQLQYVQVKIQNAQIDQRQTCGAAWTEALSWLLIVSAIITVLFCGHHF